MSCIKILDYVLNIYLILVTVLALFFGLLVEKVRILGLEARWLKRQILLPDIT